MEGPGGPQPCVKGEGGRRAGGRRLECLVCALCLGNLLLLLGVGSGPGPGRGGWLLASTYRLLVSWLVVNNSFVRGMCVFLSVNALSNIIIGCLFWADAV